MEELNTLDLLKSLTLGVNNKINQEQDSEIEYIVDTSLSNKKKKSASPIVKEVVKEKKLDNISDDFLDTEDFYESEIIEEPFDTIVENDVFVEECEDETFVDVEEESFISEEISEGVVEADILIEDDVLDSDAVDFIDSGHISEQLVENKKKGKIQRNGNPFKRGPRKKKEKIQNTVVSEELEPIKPNEIIVEDPVIEEDIVISDEAEKEPDYLEELQALNDSEFDSLFSEKIEDEDIVDSTLTLEEKDEEVEDFSDKDFEEDTFDDLSEAEMSIEVKDFSDSDFEEDTFDDLSEVEKSIEVDNKLFEEDSIEVDNDFSEEETEDIQEIETAKEIEIVENIAISEDIEDSFENHSEENDLDFLNSFSENKDNSPKEREDTIKEETSISENNSEDDKFKGCIYYKGMSVEDFLRENPNYREALYVEHFFSKEELNKLIVSGLLLIKKGKYRL